jgi:hypothetical protein
MTDIMTVKQLKAAIKAASEIVIQPRFGASEHWVKISKAEAKALAANLGPNTTTPEEAEMYSGSFGLLDGATLYLG